MPASPAADNTSSASTRPTTPTVWTVERLQALGPVIDMATAVNILGISRSFGYQLAKEGQFPVPVIKMGSRYRIPVTGLLDALNLPATEPLAADLTATGSHASITTTRSEAGPTSASAPIRKGHRDG